MQAQAVIDLVKPIIGDIAVPGATYPEAEIIDAINDGQRLVCNARADACSSTKNILLIAGSKQTIPVGSRRLVDLVRNMGADGNTSGKSIRSTVSMNDMDNFDPDWHSTVDAEVSEFIYDDRRPKEFYIWPQPTLPHYLEGKWADNPTDIVIVTDSIAIDDTYAPCLVSWAVYRLLSRDGQETPNYQRAMGHKQTVFDILGIKGQSDAAVSPNNNR